MNHNNFNKFFFSFILIFCSILFIHSFSLAFGPSSDTIFEGIDISSYQGLIDFSAVKNYGIDVVYIKTTEGNNYIDPYFEINYKNAKANGLKIGFYHYLTARNISQAKEQAIYFANSIKGKTADCRLAMDFESFGNLPVKTINEISTTFLETVESLTNSKVVIYTDVSNARTVFDASLTKYPIWIADYDVERPNPNGKWDSWVGWQFSNKGTIPGISGFVDLDKFTDGIFLESTPVLPDPNTPAPFPNNNTFVYTVKPGDTLSEIASRFNITVSEIVHLNPSIQNPNLIYPGQQFTLPNNNSSISFVYIVKPGDTLSEIAVQFNTSVSSLVMINNLSNPNLIFPGQRILINSSNNPGQCINISYKIKFGDTLSSISNRFNTTISQILRLNSFISNPNLIFSGTTITVPNCIN